MVVRINKFDYTLNKLVYATEACYATWQEAKQMCERVFKMQEDAVSITETNFASGLKQCSVATKRCIIYQITEADENKKQPVQTSIFGY
jgi:hypothetical protein